MSSGNNNNAGGTPTKSGSNNSNAAASASGETKAVTYGVFILTKHGLDDDSRRIVLVRDDGLLLLEGSSNSNSSNSTNNNKDQQEQQQQPLYTKSTLPSSTTPPELSDFFRRAELKRHVPLAKIVALDIRSQGCTIRLGIMREHDLVLSDSESGYMSQFLMALDHAVRKAAVFVKGSKALGQVFDAEDMRLERPKEFVSIHSKIERRARLRGVSLGSGGISAQRPFNLFDWNATMMPLPPVIDVSAASSPEVAKSLSDHVIIVLGHVYLHRPPDLPAPADPADRVKLRVFALSRHQLFLLMPERGEIKYKGSLFGLKRIELVPPSKKSGEKDNSRSGTPTTANNATASFPTTVSNSSATSPGESFNSASLQGVMTSAGDAVGAVLEQEKMILHMEDPQVPRFILSFKRSKSAAPTADVTNSVKTVAASICSLFERQGYVLPMVETGKQSSSGTSTPTQQRSNSPAPPPAAAAVSSNSSSGTGNNQSQLASSQQQQQVSTAAATAPPKPTTPTPTPVAATTPQQQQQPATAVVPASTSQSDLLTSPPERRSTNPPSNASSTASNHDNSNSRPSITNTANPANTSSNNNNNTGSSSTPQSSPQIITTPPAKDENDEQNPYTAAAASAAPTTPRNTAVPPLQTGSLSNNTNNNNNNTNNNNLSPSNSSPNQDTTSGVIQSSSSSQYLNAPNLSPGNTPRGSFADPGDNSSSGAFTPRGTQQQDNGDFVSHDAIPQDASASVIRMRTSAELETSKSIPDFKKVDVALKDFDNPAVLLARRVLRLTSKLRWETRICIITSQQVILCGEDKTVRRSIALLDIKECILTYHWQAAAITLLIDGAHDCVLRAHQNTPQEYAMTHVAGLITELNPAIKLARDTSNSKLRLKQVVSVGRNLQKGDGYISPAAEVKRIKEGLAPSPLQRTMSQINEAERLNNQQQQQNTSSSSTFTETTQVKDFPQKEKDRFSARVRLFYTNFHQEGLKTIDTSLPVILTTGTLTEKEVFAKMSVKYQADPAREEQEAKAKNVYPVYDNNNNNNNLAAESSMSVMHRSANDVEGGTNPLVVSGAPPMMIKDLSPTEKERLRKRVKLFYENHHKKGLETFDENMANVLGSASYTEEFLFNKMNEKYNVDPKVETQEATAAGVIYQQQQQQQQQILPSSPSPVGTSGAAKAPPIKDLSAFEKQRLRKRVKLFYENHHRDGLNNFEGNIDTVVNTATYSEEYLFTRMYDKYSVDAAVENEEATKAGVMGSKIRSRPATPKKKPEENNSGSSAPSPSPSQQQAAGSSSPTNTAAGGGRGESVSGEVNQWLSPDNKTREGAAGRNNNNSSSSSSPIIYSQVFENALDSHTRGAPLSCRAVIFDSKKQDYSKINNKNNNNIGITAAESLSVRFDLRSATPIIGLKTAWMSYQQQQQSSSSSGSSSSSTLLKEELDDNIRVTLSISSLGIVADVPLSFFCRTILPQVEVSTLKNLEKKTGNWDAVSEYSAWKVRTRAMFA